MQNIINAIKTITYNIHNKFDQNIFLYLGLFSSNASVFKQKDTL